MDRPSSKKTKLTVIPGVGKAIQNHFNNIGITCVEDLKGADPDELFIKDSKYKGFTDDRCLLYVFRLAVYYANTSIHEVDKLKWWNWKDDNE